MLIFSDLISDDDRDAELVAEIVEETQEFGESHLAGSQLATASVFRSGRLCYPQEKKQILVLRLFIVEYVLHSSYFIFIVQFCSFQV